jgi:hypothetical protein
MFRQDIAILGGGGGGRVLNQKVYNPEDGNILPKHT